MARFIGSDSFLINVDWITEVQRISDDVMRVTMIDGSSRNIPQYFFTDIVGCNVIRHVIPVHGVTAHFARNGEKFTEPVHMMAVTEDGLLRPLSIDTEIPEFLDECIGYKFIEVPGNDFPFGEVCAAK